MAGFMPPTGFIKHITTKLQAILTYIKLGNQKVSFLSLIKARMTTFIKAKLKKSYDQTNID